MHNITRREAVALRFIHEFLSEKPIVGVTEIARSMNITPTSAYEILSKLRDKGLLRKIERKGFVLTEEGEKIAKAIVFSHRIVEIILYEFFGMSAECACEIASYIDYRIGIKYALNAYHKLKLPSKCPHNKELPILAQGDNYV